MNQIDNVRDILDAIDSVRYRARNAIDINDIAQFSQLMGDLVALEQCLVAQTGLLIRDLRRAG